jgi:hypothetical protein
MRHARTNAEELPLPVIYLASRFLYRLSILNPALYPL